MSALHVASRREGMMTMRGSLGIAAGLCLSITFTWVHAAPVNKCFVDGTVTFQHGPCPSGQPRSFTTTQELNAQEKRRRAASAPASSAVPSAVPAVSPRVPVQETGGAQGGFRCDGRQYCSQMRSCAEAKYFLANCPAVKMDGNRDGVPCEQQWCRP